MPVLLELAEPVWDKLGVADPDPEPVLDAVPLNTRCSVESFWML